MERSSSIAPIDFRKLLKEEKQRARENQKKSRPQLLQTNENDDAATIQRESNNIKAATLCINNDTTLPPWKYDSTRQQHQHSWNVPLLNRKEHCVCSNPASIYFLPSFVPPQLGQDIWDWLQKLPLATELSSETNSLSSSLLGEPAAGCWHVLPHAKRKVALFHTSSSSSSNNTNNSAREPFPPPLQLLVEALIQAGVFPAQEINDDDDNDDDGPPNHILVNEYTPEQGIMPHTDGPAYTSRTATISLGQGNVLLNFVPRPEHQQQQQQRNPQSSTIPSPQLLLHGGGSLVVFENAAYLDYMHSIADKVDEGMERASAACRNAAPGTLVERQPRISLTIRRRRKRRMDGCMNE